MRATLDNLNGYYKGVEVGDWCKMLAMGHHIQTWIVYNIAPNMDGNLEVQFRRRFFDNKAVMYTLYNASEEIQFSEEMFEQYKTDPSFSMDREFESITLPFGQKMSARILVRQASMGSMVRILSRDNCFAGHVMSRLKAVHYILLDWGRKKDLARTAVKPGDVYKAREALDTWENDILPKYLEEDEE